MACLQCYAARHVQHALQQSKLAQEITHLHTLNVSAEQNQSNAAGRHHTSAARSTIALRFLLETLCATSAAYRLHSTLTWANATKQQGCALMTADV